MNAQPLQVLLVSRDRDLLGKVSKFLDVFGYDVIEATDAVQVTKITLRDPLGFVIVDGDLELCRQLISQTNQATGAAYTLLLTAEPTVDFLTDALEAGVDDFLAKPIVFGEILARLRAGARVREYQRRAKSQEKREAVSGALSRSVFVRIVERELRDSAVPGSVTCVAWNLDYFGSLTARFGQPFSTRALARISEALADNIPNHVPFACCGGDQFLTLLTEQAPGQDLSWAEQLRRTVEKSEFELDGIEFQITASFGLSRNAHDIAAEQLIQLAVEAQQLAKRSGRNCLMTSEHVKNNTDWWNSLAEPGKLFGLTVARDVMVPITVILHPHETIAHARVLFEKSRLTTIPVVCDRGELMGLCCLDSLSDLDHGDGCIRDVMEPDPPCLNEEAAVSDVLNLFARHDVPLAVVVSCNRPAGTITRSGMKALLGKVDESSFAPNVPDLGTSDYLTVCDAACDTIPFGQS